METHALDMILTSIVLSFWFLFPIGMFLSVSHVDKNTDQVVQLDHLKHDSLEAKPLHHTGLFVNKKKTTYDHRWNLPLSFKRWIHH